MVAFVLSSAISSCKRYLDVPYPTNSISTASAFTTMGSIDGMMNELYVYFGSVGNSVGLHRTLSAIADDGYSPTTSLVDMQSNNTTPAIPNAAVDWAATYSNIYWANTMLEGIPGSTAPGFTNDKKKAYMAAAKTIRAYCYFQLVRLYGDVPLITTGDVPANAVKPRAAAATIYAAIEKDLQEAIADLPATLGAKYFINNKYIPQAVLAEVYLTQGKWAQAEAAATDIINSNKYQLMGINDVFLQSSTEGILVLAPVYSTNAAISFKVSSIPFAILFPDGAAASIYEGLAFALSPSLLNSFETGDLRKTNWIVLKNAGNYSNPNNRMFAYKYKYSSNFYTGTIPAGKEEDNKIIRLAEIYLLRAEAKAQQGTDLTGAAADLNKVRIRAGLGNTVAATKAALVDAVLEERRHELFFECGYRWFDLVRTGKANTVLSALSYKINWKPYMTLFPLTPALLSTNPALTQTPGY